MLKTNAFVNYVWEAELLSQNMREAGLRVGVAVNSRDAARIHTNEIPAFNSLPRYALPHDDPQALDVLVSPRVVGEGIDVPAAEAVLWASPTEASLRYAQATGRVARITNGKSHARVLDTLFRTEQGYTYTLPRWMKSHVEQLPNGTIYVGPTHKRGVAETLPHRNARTVKELVYHRTDIPLLAKDEIPLTPQGLSAVFSGRAQRLLDIANRLRREFPDLFETRRTSKGKTVWVSTVDGLEKLIEEMNFWNIKQKPSPGSDIQTVQLPDRNPVQKDPVIFFDLVPSDLVPSSAVLTQMFRGSSASLVQVAGEVIEALSADHPEWFPQKILRDGDMATVIGTPDGRSAFAVEMIARGFKPK